MSIEEKDNVKCLNKTKIYLEPQFTKEFKVGDLFNIRPTKSYTNLKDENIISSKGTVPFITTTSLNNGIKGYSKLEPTEKGNCITASDTTDTDSIFYQKDDFIGRSHVQKWELKDFDIPFNLNIALYILSVVKKSTRGKYSYGFKFNRSEMNNLAITLPVKSPTSTEPDWEFMEKYIQQAKLQYLELRKSQHRKQFENLLEVTGRSENEFNV